MDLDEYTVKGLRARVRAAGLKEPSRTASRSDLEALLRRHAPTPVHGSRVSVTRLVIKAVVVVVALLLLPNPFPTPVPDAIPFGCGHVKASDPFRVDRFGLTTLHCLCVQPDLATADLVQWVEMAGAPARDLLAPDATGVSAFVECGLARLDVVAPLVRLVQPDHLAARLHNGTKATPGGLVLRAALSPRGAVAASYIEDAWTPDDLWRASVAPFPGNTTLVQDLVAHGAPPRSARLLSDLAGVWETTKTTHARRATAAGPGVSGLDRRILQACTGHDADLAILRVFVAAAPVGAAPLQTAGVVCPDHQSVRRLAGGCGNASTGAHPLLLLLARDDACRPALQEGVLSGLVALKHHAPGTGEIRARARALLVLADLLGGAQWWGRMLRASVSQLGYVDIGAQLVRGTRVHDLGYPPALPIALLRHAADHDTWTPLVPLPYTRKQPATALPTYQNVFIWHAACLGADRDLDVAAGADVVVETGPNWAMVSPARVCACHGPAEGTCTRLWPGDTMSSADTLFVTVCGRVPFQQPVAYLAAPNAD